MTSAATIADPWNGVDRVRLTDIARVAGVPREDLRNVERAGLVQPAPSKTGRGAPRTVTHDDALFLLSAALIAVTAGLALITVVRMLRSAGAEVGPEGVVIPVPPIGP